MDRRHSPLISGLLLAALLSWACGSSQLRDTAISADRQSQLRLSDGHSRVASLAELLGPYQATVLVFWSAGCPCVRRYQARSDELVARLQPRGIQVLGVASNADEAPADIEKARQERGIALPIWRDRGGLLAQELGVKTTPTVVVLLADGRVAYTGWIDNERLPGDPKRQAWLDQALERISAGDLTPSRKPTWGCRITQGTPEDELAPSSTQPSAEPNPSSCGCKAQPAPANSGGVTTP